MLNDILIKCLFINFAANFLNMWKSRIYILVVVIGFLSLSELIDNYQITNIAKFVVSLMGLSIAVLGFIRHRYTYVLIQMWIILQLPFIQIINESIDVESSVDIVKTLWDTSQFFLFTMGFKINDIGVYLNWFPLLFIVLLRYSRYDFKKKKQEKFHIWTSLDNGEDELLTVAEASHEMIFTDCSQWILVELEKCLNYNDKKYEYAFIQAVDSNGFAVNTKQKTNIRLIEPHGQIDFLPKEIDVYDIYPSERLSVERVFVRR